MSIQGNPYTIHDSSLVLSLDAANPKSYGGSGTVWYDLSGNGYNGTLTNTPTFTSSYCGGIVFNGTNNYVAVNTMYNLATTNQLTAIIWAKSATSTWNDNGFLMSKRDQFIIHPNGGGTSVDCYTNTNAGWQSTSFSVSNITTYNQYCMTYNAGTLVSYLNGLYANSRSVGATLSSDVGELDIGKDDTYSRYFNGIVGLAQVYNRALSNVEILQNYNTLKSRFGL